MEQILEAVYANGVLTPLEPLHLVGGFSHLQN